MARPVAIKDQLDDAAIHLFAAKGVDATSIKDIAQAAGVSQGALYRHYKTKDEMADRLFVSRYLMLAEHLDILRTEAGSFPQALSAMVGAFCALFDDNEPLFRFLLLSQHRHLAAVPAGARTPVEVIADTLQDAMAAGDIPAVPPDLKAAAVMGIVLQTATFHVYGRLTGGLKPLAPSLTAACLAAARAPAKPTEA